MSQRTTSINALVGLQSLRSLKIGESRCPEYDPLLIILSRSSAGLESIAITYWTTIAVSPFLSWRPPLQRPRIQKLTLFSSPRVFDLLNDSACPFGFHYLEASQGSELRWSGAGSISVSDGCDCRTPEHRCMGCVVRVVPHHIYNYTADHSLKALDIKLLPGTFT
jgi:hypothetical protein